MTVAQAYLNDLKAKLIACPLIRVMSIVSEWAVDDRGYLRARLTLVNGDFLEVSEYYVVQAGVCIPVEYRHQWMDAAKQLRKRWDNAAHFPKLPNSPHHIHIGNTTVVPGELLSIEKLMEQLTQELN